MICLGSTIKDRGHMTDETVDCGSGFRRGFFMRKGRGVCEGQTGQDEAYCFRLPAKDAV